MTLRKEKLFHNLKKVAIQTKWFIINSRNLTRGNNSLIRTVGDFQANYKAIILSEKLSECRKNTLLRNLLNDIENNFFGTCNKEQSIIEQKKEAKSLYKQIKKNLINS